MSCCRALRPSAPHRRHRAWAALLAGGLLSGCAGSPPPPAAAEGTEVSLGASPPSETSAPSAPEPAPAPTPTTAPKAAPSASPAAATESPKAAEAKAPEAPPAPCLAAPAATRHDRRVAFPRKAGCALATADATSLDRAAKLRIVEVELTGAATIVRFVLLDADDNRLEPPAVSVGYELELLRNDQGSRNVTTQQEGIYTLRLAPNGLPKLCEIFVKLSVTTSHGPLDDVVDEWRPAGC